MKVRELQRVGLWLLIHFLVGCSGGSGGSDTVSVASEDQVNLDQRNIADDPASVPALVLEEADSPLDITGLNARFYADIPYGAGEQNVLDIFLPDTDGPSPLVIYFHGGGYISGDKSMAYSLHEAEIREILEAGVAFATINYSLLSTQFPYEHQGVMKPLTESARALQFLRYHFKSLNLDPEQIASFGLSAGGSTSLWLGTHDDLADPDNIDPVLRESTRIRAVGALLTQATLNLPAWGEFLWPLVEENASLFGDADFSSVVSTLNLEAHLFAVTGTNSVAEILSAEKKPYFDNIDMLANMDAFDAPIFAANASSFAEGDLSSLFLHHALHVLALHDRATEVGLHNVMYANDPIHELEDPSGEELVSFLLRHIR